MLSGYSRLFGGGNDRFPPVADTGFQLFYNWKAPERRCAKLYSFWHQEIGFRMTRGEAFDWVDVAFAATALGVESANVVWLRTVKASRGGPKAADEAWRMYSEKMASLAELQGRFLTGSMGHTPAATARAAVKHYRSKVAANHRRLGKG